MGEKNINYREQHENEVWVLPGRRKHFTRKVWGFPSLWPVAQETSYHAKCCKEEIELIGGVRMCVYTYTVG